MIAVLRLIIILPFLTGCGDVLSFKLASAGVTAATYGLFSDPDVNLKAKSYAAADYLASEMKKGQLRRQVLSVPYAPSVIVRPLVELDNERISSAFGSAVPEWVGRRLSELGYDVYLNNVAPEDNVSLYPAPPEDIEPDLFLKGTYAVRDKYVDVMLRIFNAQTGQIEAKFDYTIPVNREVRSLSKTEPRIFRAKSSGSNIVK